MIVLGVDPGYATTGVGVIEKIGAKLILRHYDAITTPPDMPFEDRLASLYHDLRLFIQYYRPETAGVESVFFSNNAKTAMQVSQARGVILLALKHENLSIASYTPPEVKSGVCGYGNAQKQQVQYMVMKLLSLSKKPKPDDAADALAVAICHAHLVRLRAIETSL